MWILFAMTIVMARAQVIMDYAGGPTQGDAWIILETPGAEWELQRLIWCKSLVPNDQQPTELPHDCMGRNLMRQQLYPPPSGSGPIVVKDSDTPNRYYVDPNNVGGWDTRHQWIIWMQMVENTAAKSTLVHVVRFNAISPIETTTTVATVVPTTSSANNLENTESNPSLPGGPDTSSPSVEQMITERPWLGFALILGVGFAIIGAAIVTYRLTRPGSTDVVTRMYGGDTLIWAVRDEEEEDARLREEDLQILSKIGN